MNMTTLLRAGACALSAIAAGVIFASSSWAQTAPRYEADINWPKPLPDRWVLGGLGGHCVDAKDHVLILNRQDLFDGDLHAGKLAPPLIEFDPAGNVVNSWGDLKLIDPRLHSCHFDKDGNVWIASAPSGMVQKYTRDGKKLLLQIGIKGKLDSSDGTAKGKPLNTPGPTFFMPSSIFVDRSAVAVDFSPDKAQRLLFVLNQNNSQIEIIERATGKHLGSFGRAGAFPGQFNQAHGIAVDSKGNVYVSENRGKRIHKFRPVSE